MEGEDIFVCVFLCWKLTLLCLIQLGLKLKIFLVLFYAGNLRYFDCFVKLFSLERVCFFWKFGFLILIWKLTIFIILLIPFHATVSRVNTLYWRCMNEVMTVYFCEKFVLIMVEMIILNLNSAGKCRYFWFSHCVCPKGGWSIMLQWTL